MATAIDVFFTGLMLICLDGQSNCPSGENTAWVVKADGKSMPCGRRSPERTQLEITYSPDDFTRRGGAIQCVPEPRDGRLRCILPEDRGEGEICVLPSPEPRAGNSVQNDSLRGLLRLNEVDLRLGSVRRDRLNDRNYVPVRIRFPHGRVGVGRKWPPSDDKDSRPIQWSRSNGSMGQGLPRELSDRLKITYPATMSIALTDCRGKTLIVLDRKPSARTAEIVLRNAAIERPVAEQVGNYDVLSYLIWYYPLGSWPSLSGKCPLYTPENRDAILLRCVREGGQDCAFYAKGDTVFWKPKLMPLPE